MKRFAVISVVSCVLYVVVFTSGETSPSDPPEKPIHVNTTEPKLNDFQESSKKTANHPESRVTITVGEDNGFQYTVNGLTHSRERIAVSGEYFNDELNRYGYARLFLDAQPSIVYYAVRPVGNRLDVYVQNYYYEEFYYEVYTPYPVDSYDLRHGQVNSTSVLITGPSRSAVGARRSSVNKGNLVTTSKKP